MGPIEPSYLGSYENAATVLIYDMFCCEAITVDYRENIKIYHFFGKEDIKLYFYSILIFIMMSSSPLHFSINKPPSNL